MTSSIQPVGLPYLNVDNLTISYTSGTTLTISSGRARDNTNSNDMTDATSKVLNSAVVGLNGIDAGVLQASKMYAIYQVDSTQNKGPSGVMLSLSLTQPALPFNYDAFRLIGFWPTTGAAAFSIGSTIGNGKSRRFVYDTKVAGVTAGAATTFADIDLSNLVPSISGLRYTANCSFTGATAATAVCDFRPYGSSATLVERINGAVNAQALFSTIPLTVGLNTGAPVTQYQVSNGSDALTLWVTEFEYSI